MVMIDELEQMRRRRAAVAYTGFDVGDTVSLPSEAFGLPVPADAPRVDYMVAVVDGDTIKLRSPSPPAAPEHLPGARRPGRKSMPPVPRWARRRGHR